MWLSCVFAQRNEFAALTFVTRIKIDFLAAAFTTLKISPLFLLLLLLMLLLLLLMWLLLTILPYRTIVWFFCVYI
jgi:hypothetical protein